MLKINNLTKTYGGNGKPSVDNLTLEVKDGEIFGFIGPNGAGKSTTIKCITGIVSFEGGSIQIDGIDLKNSPIEAKRQIGYVSDDHILYEGLTGVEFVNFICDIFNVSAADRKLRLKKYLELFALEDAIGKQIKGYSHGMKQKLNIIGALIHNPKLWILDEPMTGLDPKSSYNLKQLMKEHAAAGNSVFFSSHVLEVVEKVCDRIGIIDDGKLITACTLAELKESGLNNSLEELFLKLTDTENNSATAATKESAVAKVDGATAATTVKATENNTANAVEKDKNNAEKDKHIAEIDKNSEDKK
ncbi:MAG: ABC transporter ATP-binding protein [Clostridia bacterium]